MKNRLFSLALASVIVPVMASAQQPLQPLNSYETEVYAAAESYISDPQWANSQNDTSSSIKKDKCEEGNFFKMGFNRAYNSKKRDKGLEKIAKKCKKVDVNVDETAYHHGYDKGLLARCSFFYGLRQGRQPTVYSQGDMSWTGCDREQHPRFYEGHEIGKTHMPILRQHKVNEQNVISLEDRIVLLEYDMNNGTDTAEIGTAKKTDFLTLWNRQLREAQKDIVLLETKHDDVFDTSEIRDENRHFMPKHWRDQP